MYDKMVYYYINFDYSRMIIGMIAALIVAFILLFLLSDGKFFDEGDLEARMGVCIVLALALFLGAHEVSLAMSENRLSVFEKIDTSRITSTHQDYIPSEEMLTDETGTEYFTYEEAQEYWYEHYY